MKKFFVLLIFFASFLISDEMSLWIGVGAGSFKPRYDFTTVKFSQIQREQIYPISFSFCLKKSIFLEFEYFSYSSIGKEMYGISGGKINSLLFNLKYSLLDNRISPYILLGLNKTNVEMWSDIQGLKDDYLKWQAGLGFKYKIFDKSFLFLEYKFFRTGNPFEKIINISKIEADILSIGIKTKIF